jgi:Phage tail assembly chaperone proteins, E, or 41 or 14
MNEATTVNTGTVLPGYEPLKPQQPAQVPQQAAPQPQPQAEPEIDYGAGEERLSPEEQAIADAVADPLSHPLTKAIQAHGEALTILKWREPTGNDIERAGNPIVMDSVSGGGMRVTFDEKKMSAMICQLAAVPPSAVRQMVARDWNAVAFKVFRFFM